MPVLAAASNAGWAKWALAAIASVTAAMHKAFEIQWPSRERQRLPKKTPRLRAGRAARVGGKRRAGGGPSGHPAVAKRVRRAIAAGRRSNARCMASSGLSMEFGTSMPKSVLRTGPQARGRIQHRLG